MAWVMDSETYKTWKRDGYTISMDPSLIPISQLNDAFASSDMYWAKPVPEDVMRETLQNSLCFGLYKTEAATPNSNTARPESISTSNAPTDPINTFIGIARLVTDKTTFVYLTDVYIDPAYQGEGLGTWLVSCVQEVIEGMPYLRRSILFTGDWKRSVPFYERTMEMKVVEGKKGEGLAFMERRGPGHPLWEG
ncbi:hypothetical protein DL98DRAFT_574069 [Cadophora sp. DSE1049]|nr:hypothetical protein DL98DRAFT_574069 [Cadophora sp. DSE1049]